MGILLKRFRSLKSVPRPSEGKATMFVHVLASGEEVLTCMFADGSTEQVLDAETTEAQLGTLEQER